MTYLLVQYGVPVDPAAFDKYYRERHIPLAKTLPGLREYTISDGRVEGLAGSAAYLVALLQFDSRAAVEAALVSPEGKATAGDLENFATGGVTLAVFEGRVV